jgi:hypothetical protein
MRHAEPELALHAQEQRRAHIEVIETWAMGVYRRLAHKDPSPADGNDAWKRTLVSDVGDVVRAEEPRRDVGGREPDLAVEDVLEHVVLAEILHEPGRAQDRPLRARGAHGPLGALGLGLAAESSTIRGARLRRASSANACVASTAPGSARSGW